MEPGINAANPTSAVTTGQIPEKPRLGLPGKLLLRQGSALFLAVGAVQILNYTFHVVMSRALGPGDYGALVALLSLILLLAVPMNTLQTTIALRAAGAAPTELRSLVGALLKLMQGPLLVVGIVAWSLLSFLSPGIATLLRLGGAVPVIIIGSFLVIAPLLPTVRGVLQGIQAFGLLGATFLIESGGKVIFGVILVTLGLGIGGAAGGIMLGALAALACGWRMLPRPASTNGDIPLNAFALLSAAGPVAMTLLLFTILTNADIVTAKALFPPREAGYYAAASTAGKVTLYATWPVWAMLFPLLGREGNISRRTRRQLALGIGLTLVIAAPILFVYVLIPRVAAGILFGPQYLPSATLFWRLGLAMLAYQVGFLSMSHELAFGRWRFLRLTGLSTLVLVGLLLMVPRTLGNLAMSTLAVGVTTAVAMSWFTLAGDR